MTAKEYLKQVRQAELRVEALRERRRRCADWSGDGSGGGPGLDALRRELDERIEACAALVREVEARIDALDNPLRRDVLKYRYLNGWSWRVISCRMGLSRDWLMSVHRKAIGELENLCHGDGSPDT